MGLPGLNDRDPSAHVPEAEHEIDDVAHRLHCGTTAGDGHPVVARGS
jgi:hypothetical protein